MNTITSTSSTRAARTRPSRDLALAMPAVSVACFSVHLVLLVATGTAMLAMALSMLVLSGICVACTWHAGARHVRRDYLVAAALALTMIVVHLLLMPPGSDMTGSGMDHAGMGHAGMEMGSEDRLLSASVVDRLMQAGIALAAMQVVLAAAAALRPTRRDNALPCRSETHTSPRPSTAS